MSDTTTDMASPEHYGYRRCATCDELTRDENEMVDKNDKIIWLCNGCMPECRECSSKDIYEDGLCLLHFEATRLRGGNR